MATQVIRVNNLSGTNFNIDVTLLELDSNVAIKDFIVTHNGTDVTNLYTKTSPTIINYSGPNVASGTYIMVRRNTDYTPADSQFLTVTTALELTSSLTKARKRIEETQAYIDFLAQQLAANNITLGVSPVVDQPYGTSWQGDTTRAPSRDKLYAKLSSTDNTIATLAPINSPSFTGAPTAPTPSNTDNSTRVATTAFSQSILTNAVNNINSSLARPLCILTYYVANTGNLLTTPSATIPFIVSTDTHNGWNNTTKQYTVPAGQGGTYLLGATVVLVYKGTTKNGGALVLDKTDTNNNTTSFRISQQIFQAQNDYFGFNGCFVLQLNAGDKITFRFVTFGNSFEYADNNTNLAFIVKLGN